MNKASGAIGPRGWGRWHQRLKAAAGRHHQRGPLQGAQIPRGVSVHQEQIGCEAHGQTATLIPKAQASGTGTGGSP